MEETNYENAFKDINDTNEKIYESFQKNSIILCKKCNNLNIEAKICQKCNLSICFFCQKLFGDFAFL